MQSSIFSGRAIAPTLWFLAMEDIPGGLLNNMVKLKRD